jgi:uncharacterized protein (DUF1778 family)
VFESRYTVTVNLREPPKNGTAQLVWRCQAVDRNLVTKAAKLLGISVNSFMRAAVIQTAQQVLEINEPAKKSKGVSVDHVTRLLVSPELPPGVKR